MYCVTGMTLLINLSLALAVEKTRRGVAPRARGGAV